LKKCKKCNIEKSINEFYRDCSKKDGHHSHCKECVNAHKKINAEYISQQKKQYRLENKEKIREYEKKYRDINQDKIIEINKRSYNKHKNRRQEKQQQYRLENKDKKYEYDLNYRQQNKETIVVKRSKHYQENKNTILDKVKKYKKNNEEKINEYARNYNVNRRKIDLDYKLRQCLRTRISNVIKNHKAGSAIRDLGCSIDEFKQRLEGMFYSHPETEEMMSWSNYGLYGWHIDHIIPLSSFDLTDREQFLKACHYTNLQPLWAEDNLKKGSK